jgi:hypothetical protein
LQEAPHWQLAVLAAAFTFWQPQVHAAPGQDTHGHEFDLVDMIDLLELVDLLSI